MKKKLLSFLLVFVVISMMFTGFSIASSFNYDVQVEDDVVKICVQGAPLKPVSIVIENGGRKHYIDQTVTDTSGKGIFKTRLEKEKVYNCVVNIDGVTESSTIVIDDIEEDDGGGVTKPPAKPKYAYISIEGYKGTILAKTKFELTKSYNVMELTKEVLENEGIDYKIRNGYMAEIDGQGEFDKGANSGWMFSVNDKFPTIGADSVEVKNGDYIKWVYTTDLGEDVGNSYSGKNEEAPKEELQQNKSGDKVIDEAVDSTINWILKNNDLTEWQVIALVQAGVMVPENCYINLEKYVKAEDGNFRKITDYCKIFMAAAILGKNPENIAGFNFAEKIYNNDRMTSQGLNGPAFSLIALDMINTPIPEDAKWTREKLISHILQQQKNDGGFSLTPNQKSEIDITAMVIQALSSYQDNKNVKSALQNAIDFLSKNQLDDGGYLSFNGSNSESVSQTIIALTSLGIDPKKDPRFIKEGDLISNLLSYRLPEGGFAHTKGQGQNDMATEQALLALVSYQKFLKNGKWVYHITHENLDKDGVFADIQSASSWAKEYIVKAKAHGLMEGRNKERFEPKGNITRAEFATLLIRLLKESPKSEGQQVFIDVKPESWYFGYVMKAYEKQIVYGKTADRFYPADNITREEMAVMLQRVLSIEGDSEDIKDIQDASSWAHSAIKAVFSNGIMIGNMGMFNPKEQVTREMAAVVIVRIFENSY